MKIGRNDPCLCGSGKKYKKCCAMFQEKPQRKVPELPPFITCNECGGQAPKETFTMLDTEGLTGIDLAFMGTCEDCEMPTIAATGDPAAVQYMMTQMNEEIEADKMGVEFFKS